MFAIIEDGGKQYKVKEGDVINLELKSDLKENDDIVINQVLLLNDGKKTEIVEPFVKASVNIKVLEHGRGDKIRVVKFKAKKRHHKVQGHRQSFTKVKVISIKK